MRKLFVYRKKIKEYDKAYRELCDKRTLLYHSVGYEEPLTSIENADNFLFELKMFMKKVPRRVIRERYDDFRDAKDLAVEVLK